MTIPVSPSPSRFPGLLGAGLPLSGIALAALAAVGAYLIRYGFIEPEALGDFCTAQGVDGPAWCGLRTGLIVATKWRVFGWGAVILAVSALFSGPRRRAVILSLAAMAAGGAGLYFYNATESAIALMIALVRLANLGAANPGGQPR
ncbi:MAG: hypothetical protein HQL36_06045 [Alphaproteobacteria bacterium]|nr:hypothetical protein [Alphaproteobacteria bacterium]MBF0250878.1 hypothetical protein [Alphaproteobacteria bacterium]